MNRIKQLREERDWNQDYLANLLSVKRAAVSKYETEKIPLTKDTILLLSKIFDVSADYLLGVAAERQNQNKHLANEQGDQIIHRALKDTGLLSADGTLSAEGEDVISAFLKNNAEILKKLIKEDK